MTDHTSSIGLGADMEPSIHTSNTSESGFDGSSAGDDATDSGNGIHAAPSGGSSASAATIQRASLGSGAEGLVLFDLTTKEGAKVAYSPNVCSLKAERERKRALN